MASELRKKALEADDIRSEVMDIPEWDGEFEVRGMNGSQRARFLRNASNPGTGEVNFEKFFANLLIITVHDPETGEAVFDEADRDALNAKSGAVINRLANKAQELSGLGESAVKEAEKN